MMIIFQRMYNTRVIVKQRFQCILQVLLVFEQKHFPKIRIRTSRVIPDNTLR